VAASEAQSCEPNSEAEVVVLDGQRSFLHMAYAYSYGLAGQLTACGYLATVGRNKVGFIAIDRHLARY
jgi:hypothetical protein